MIEIIPNWHPVFVHFTVALLSVSGVLFLVSHFASDWQHRQTALKVAEWNFWIGSAVTVATALAGWYAYNTVSHDTPSHAAMTLHRNWALGTLTLLGVLVFWRWILQRGESAKSSLSFVVVMPLLLGLLGSTAWHGGEVVYRYGLGVMSMPTSEGDGHAHEHADGQEHSANAPEESGNSDTDEKHDGLDHSNHEH